jgi:excisionase family DNA binding protein
MGMIMNIREVSVKIKISVSTLRKYVMRKEIPFKKVGTRVVFDETQIDAWLNGLSDGLDSIGVRPGRGGNKRQGNKREMKTAELFPAENKGAGV